MVNIKPAKPLRKPVSPPSHVVSAVLGTDRFMFRPESIDACVKTTMNVALTATLGAYLTAQVIKDGKLV